MSCFKPIATFAASVAIASGSSYLGYALASRYLPEPASTLASAPTTTAATLVEAPAPGTTITIPAMPALPAEITVQTAQVNSSNQVTLQVFRADRTCEGFTAESVAVPASDALNAAVGRAIANSLGADFPLAGYRVSRSQGTATVELRLPPNAERGFTSLSPCEQFALFGSLRETLTKNPSLQVNQVRFTQQGQELYL